MPSGWSLEGQHKIACLGLFKDRCGRAFDFFPSFEYLKDKNKFSSFRTKCDEDNVVAKRPIGKNQVRQTEHDAKLNKAIVSELVVKKEKTSSGVVGSRGGSEPLLSEFDAATTGAPEEAMGDVLQNILNVIANVGTAVLENMKTEQDMRFLQSLDTPYQKMNAKEQLALRMAETCQKKRRIEFTSSGVSVIPSIKKPTNEDEEDMM